MKFSDADKKRGQTLVEIVVIIGVVLLMVTGLIAGATASLKAANFSRAKSIAAKYAQEAIEVTRKLRDTNWDTFQTYGTAGGKLWCLNKDNIWLDAATTGGVCQPNVADSYVSYTRSVNLTWNDVTSIMKTDIEVSWMDGTKKFSVALSSYFTKWR